MATPTCSATRNVTECTGSCGAAARRACCSGATLNMSGGSLVPPASTAGTASQINEMLATKMLGEPHGTSHATSSRHHSLLRLRVRAVLAAAPSSRPPPHITRSAYCYQWSLKHWRRSGCPRQQRHRGRQPAPWWASTSHPIFFCPFFCPVLWTWHSECSPPLARVKPFTRFACLLNPTEKFSGRDGLILLMGGDGRPLLIGAGRKAGRREATAARTRVKRARGPESPGAHAGRGGKIIGPVVPSCRYLGVLGQDVGYIVNRVKTS